MEPTELSQLIEISKQELGAAKNEYLAAQKKWDQKKSTHDALMIEYNKISGNFESMEWLIKNPTAEGQYDAISKKMKELYGGNFNGPHHCGYVHDNDYKPIQQSFNLHLTDYDGVISHRENIEHFFENFLQYFVPYIEIYSRHDESFPEVFVIGFQYRSEDSGLSYIGYDPVGDDWYHYTLRYGMVDADSKFETLNRALDYIYIDAKQFCS